MALQNAQVKRVSLIDFEKIKSSILSDIEFANSNYLEPFYVDDPYFEKFKKTPEQIEEKRNELRAQLMLVKKIEKLAKHAPQFFSKRNEIPRVVLDNCSYWSNQNSHYVIFHDLLYGCSGPYKEYEFKALVIGEFDRERRYLERLHCIGQDTSGLAIGSIRERIPEKVRMAVWRRDGGKCVKCRSREKLEYDHIIPVSLGGGNTARNVELLCEKCNRSKGASIG